MQLDISIVHIKNIYYHTTAEIMLCLGSYLSVVNVMKIIKGLAVKSLSSSSNPINYLLWLSPYVCLTIPCGFIQPNIPALSIVLDVAIARGFTIANS